MLAVQQLHAGCIHLRDYLNSIAIMGSLDERLSLQCQPCCAISCISTDPGRRMPNTELTAHHIRKMNTIFLQDMIFLGAELANHLIDEVVEVLWLQRHHAHVHCLSKLVVGILTRVICAKAIGTVAKLHSVYLNTDMIHAKAEHMKELIAEHGIRPLADVIDMQPDRSQDNIS